MLRLLFFDLLGVVGVGADIIIMTYILCFTLARVVVMEVWSGESGESGECPRLGYDWKRIKK